MVKAQKEYEALSMNQAVVRIAPGIGVTKDALYGLRKQAAIDVEAAGWSLTRPA